MNVTISPRPNSPAGKGCATLFLSCFAIAGLVFTALMVKVGFETIAGAVLWELEKVPALAEVRLIGFTRGKGTGDGATVETVTFDAGARRRHPRVQLRRAERTLQFLRYTHRAPLGRRVRREAGPRIPAHRDHDRTWSGGDHTAANRAARAQRNSTFKRPAVDPAFALR